MQMDTLRRIVRSMLDTEAGNLVAAEAAITPEVASLRMHGDALLGVAAADDPIFSSFASSEVVGPHFALPGEWLPGAKSVLSVFFSFTDRVTSSNAREPRRPSPEWLHARIEGQAFIDAVMRALCDALSRAGYAAVVPCDDPRFSSAQREGSPEKCGGRRFTSTWSERHVAYACGLGTFGLAAGIITKSGAAGRLGSLVTTLPLPPTPRAYSRFDAYCTMCGACARACPAGAISMESGKDHVACSLFLDETRAAFAPRYGCGKCQVGVPCADRAPGA